MEKQKDVLMEKTAIEKLSKLLKLIEENYIHDESTLFPPDWLFVSSYLQDLNHVNGVDLKIPDMYKMNLIWKKHLKIKKHKEKTGEYLDIDIIKDIFDYELKTILKSTDEYKKLKVSNLLKKYMTTNENNPFTQKDIDLYIEKLLKEIINESANQKNDIK